MRFVLATAAVVGAAALAAHRAARGRRLGATARRGPRTGTVEVNPREVDDLVGIMLTQFEPCGAGRSKPPDRRVHVPPSIVRDQETGRGRRIEITVVPEVRGDVHVSGKAFTAVQGNGRINQWIELYPSQRCTWAADWAARLRSTLAHELAHTTDPGLIRRAHLYSSPDVATRDGYEEYLNREVEIVANLAAVHNDLLRARPLDLIDMPPDYNLRAHSSRWNDLEPYLTPANKRRFYRLAARVHDEVVAQQAAGARRAGAKWRKRQLVEHVVRTRRARRKVA